MSPRFSQSYVVVFVGQDKGSRHGPMKHSENSNRRPKSPFIFVGSNESRRGNEGYFSSGFFFGGQCMPKCTHVVVASPFSRVTQRPVF